MPDTLLVLTGIGVAPYSARGLTQTLEPIDALTAPKRTVNGASVDVSAPQFRKFRSTIACNDQMPPAFNGIWKGQIVTVDCVKTWAYPTGGTPDRTVVPGSSVTAEGFVTFRPRLVMRVVNFTTNEDEYGHMTNWSLDLEEV